VGKVPTRGVPTKEGPGRAVAAVQALALLAAAFVVVITAPTAHWLPGRLLVIAVLAVGSDLTAVASGSYRLRVSGSFFGIMLAAVLLGGGPAAVVGVLSIAFGWLRTREAAHYLRNNLLTFAWFPLLSGLAFQAAVHATDAGQHDPGYYLLVFAAFMLALALNFVGIAGYQCYLDGTTLTEKVREALAPILASELFSALMTAVAVYLTVKSGTVGLALFGLVLIVFQYLVGALLLSKRRAEDLERMATTDELTGLPNRESFRVRLQEQIDAVDGGHKTFAVMLMDLDRFKEVNDTLGHHYGDVLLRKLGPRLVRCVGSDGFVARLGGDEFAVLSARTGDPSEHGRLASRLLSFVQQPVMVDELSLEVGASIGIARFPEDGTDAHQLLRRADIAMYAAKSSQSGVKQYSPEEDQHSLRRLSVVGELRRAIESDEVVVHYQPQVGLDDMRVHGVEALARWQHPTFGLLPPSSFISAVEQTGLIGPLTRHVLNRSIEQCASWRREGRDLCVAVNLSVRNLLDRDLPNEIEAMLDSYHVPAEALQLELTESMIMSDPDRALATLTRLKELGVRISVDDFGTGYSSLANLKRLPIDELKIDRSFVTPMLHDESNLIIVRSTVNLGHDLGLKVTAEGVEDDATLRRLSLLGCDLAQGYHLSRPLPLNEFDDWLVLRAWQVSAVDPVHSLDPVSKQAAAR
jgi:diguanylate cyclase (GGDEF)-like protein